MAPETKLVVPANGPLRGRLLNQLQKVGAAAEDDVLRVDGLAQRGMEVGVGTAADEGTPLQQRHRRAVARQRNSRGQPGHARAHHDDVGGPCIRGPAAQVGGALHSATRFHAAIVAPRRNGELLGGGEGNAFAEDLHPALCDAGQQAVIDRHQHPHCGSAVAVQQRSQLARGEVVLLRSNGQRGQHGALALGHGTAGGEAAQLIHCLAELVEQIKGEIHAAPLHVFLYIAQNVGQLKGHAGLFGEVFRARVAVSEDADADQADDRCHQVAVAVEVVEGGIGLDGAQGSRFEVRD